MRIFFFFILMVFIQCKSIPYNVELEKGISYNKINKSDALGRQGLWITTINAGHSMYGYFGHRLGTYKNNEKNGLWQNYYKKELTTEAYFKENKLHGVTYIYQKGKLQYQLSFHQGKLNGTSRYFSKRGKLIGIYQYEHSKLIDKKCFKSKKCDTINLEEKIPFFTSI